MMSKLEKYPKYKESGVEWLGEIPEGWEIKKLKFLVKNILGGGTPESSNNKYWSDELHQSYLWVSISDITQSEFIQDTKKYITISGLRNCSAKIIPPYSILYSIYASLGKVAYSDKVLTTNQAILSIIFQDSYYSKFMFYYLKTLTQVAIKLSNSTTQDNISLEILKNLFFSIPSFKEQTKIANYLDQKIAQIDKAISLKEQMIEKLKERRQILINDAVTKGLDKTVKMKDSGVEWIGEIPEHWETVKSKRLFMARKEKAQKGDEQLTASQKHGVIYQKDYMELEGRKVTQVETNYKILKRVEPNDFLISMRSFQGGIEYCRYAGSVSSAYVALIPIKHVVSEYFRYLFKSYVYIQALASTSNLVRDGQALRFDNFSLVDLIIIPEKEQGSIAKYLDEQIPKIDNAINLQQQQITKLKEYKTTLIDSVVTGKVRVN